MQFNNYIQQFENFDFQYFITIISGSINDYRIFTSRIKAPDVG